MSVTFTKKLWILLGFLSVLILFGCKQNGSSSKKFRIAFSQCIGSDAWRETMLKEMKRELSFHPQVEFLYTDAEGDNQKQIEQVRDLLNKGIDLLIISPNEAEPLTPIVDSVFRQNIPVIVTDRKTSSGLYNAYVGADNHAIGALAAQYLSNHLHDQGHIALITGLPGTSASVEREEGFRSALKEYPQLQIHKTIRGKWLKTTTAEEIQTNLSDFQAVDALFAFNDQMAIAAIQSLKNTTKAASPLVIGVDALPGEGNGLEQILNGNMTASLLYPTGGSESIKTALAVLHKQPYQRENLLSTAVVDKTNASLLNLQYQKIDNQQNDIDRQQQLLDDQHRIYNSQKNTLNVLIVSLVLAVVFGGIAIIALKSNWEKNKHLELQNNEIVQQQNQLIQMSKQIKESSDARSNFFTNISHEFKTPLTLIITPLEDLMHQKILPKEIIHQLERMKRNAEKLLKLVNELIDIQRFSKEKLNLKASPHDLNKFMNRIVLSFKPLSIKKKIAITYGNPTSIQFLWFDNDLMEKVFDNLISNALKFTEKHGRIDIRTELNQFGDHLLIRIIDNGKGINREHIDHIFDPFYQGVRSQEGSGIGLALAKEIVTMHHGQITVSSKENEGTSFTLRLPVGDQHLTEEEKDFPPTSSSEETLKPNITLEVEPSELERCLVIHSGHTYKLLVVDDHFDVLDLLTEKLQKHYNLYTAPNAEQALKIAFKTVPDLIITDVMLPGKNGFDLVKILKADSRTSHVPIIVLSAVDSEENKLEGARVMADAYMTKPFHIERLLATVANLIKSREDLKGRYQSEINITHIRSDKNTSEMDRAFLNNLSAIVETNISNPKLTVEGIAAQMNLSRIQLYRRVKHLLDCGVNDYILTRRLKKAQHLIIEGYNINEISEKVGFASSTYFATAFKKAYGMSPTAFKKSKF